MTVLGHVRNGAIVLDQPLRVPEGTVARVELLTSNQSGATRGGQLASSWVQSTRNSDSALL